MQRLLSPAPWIRPLSLAAAALVPLAAAACSCSSEAPGPSASSGSGGSSGGAPTTSTGASSSTSSAGTGGAGGSGGDWLHDPALWEPIAPDVPCEVHAAKLPSDRIPRRSWSPCGPGCLRAPAHLPGLELAGFVTGAEIDGDIYYHVLSAMIQDKYAVGANEVTRLSDDRPAILLRHPNYCYALSGLSSPLVFSLHPLDPPGALAYVGVASAPGAEVVWALPGFELPAYGFNPFDFEGGWGFIATTSTVKVATTPGSSVFETAFSSAGYALGVVGRGPQVVWSDWSDYDPVSHRARIRSWTKAGGTLELCGGDYDVTHIALSDEKMAWTGGFGAASVEGYTESEQLFWSPRATSPAEVLIHEGPVLPHTEATSGRLATYGDWAATTVNTSLAMHVLVVDLASGQIWSIPPRPGKRFRDVLAIDVSFVLVQESDVDSIHPMYIDSLVRLDLSELDALAGGLQ